MGYSRYAIEMLLVAIGKRYTTLDCIRSSPLAKFENLDLQLEYGRSTGILELYRYRYGRGTGTAAAQQYSGTIRISFFCKFAPKFESDPKKFRNPAAPRRTHREMVGPNSVFTLGKFIFKIKFRSHGAQNIEL